MVRYTHYWFQNNAQIITKHQNIAIILIINFIENELLNIYLMEN